MADIEYTALGMPLEAVGMALSAASEQAALRCAHCLDEGYVCEDHPDRPWEGEWGAVEGHAEHGGAGMPCRRCCSPIPEDGTHSITEAFTPDWKRT